MFGIYDEQHNHLIKYFALASFIISLFAVVKVGFSLLPSSSDALLDYAETRLTIAQSLYFTFVKNDGAIALGDDERAPLVA